MYKQVETYPQIFLANTAVCRPVASLENEHGSSAHFIVDDHCYVLVHNAKNSAKGSSYGHQMTSWIFPEAVEVLRTLPPLSSP